MCCYCFAFLQLQHNRCKKQKAAGLQHPNLGKIIGCIQENEQDQKQSKLLNEVHHIDINEEFSNETISNSDIATKFQNEAKESKFNDVLLLYSRKWKSIKNKVNYKMKNIILISMKNIAMKLISNSDIATKFQNKTNKNNSMVFVVFKEMKSIKDKVNYRKKDIISISMMKLISDSGSAAKDQNKTKETI